jgi:hypothetical protein
VISLELLLGIASLLAAVVSATAVMLLYRRLHAERQEHYDFQHKRALIDPSREFVEKKIEDLYLQLYRDRERWTEINHVLLDAARAKADSGIAESRSDHLSFMRTSRFLRDMGLSDRDFAVDERSVFVLTPFHQSHNKTYSVISSVCLDLRLQCSRGDEEFVDGPLLSHIVKQIVSASFLIANVNGRNPNVFYELGIAHTLGKRVIIVSKNYETIPFDLRSQQIVLYDDLDDLRSGLKDAVARLAVRALSGERDNGMTTQSP